MNIPSLFKEYIWLVETIHHAKRISLADLNRKWILTDLSGGIKMARSTFYRYKEAIQDIFGLIIECDRKNGYEYYIENEHVLYEDSVQNWMLSTLSISNILDENLSMQDRILLEQIPSGDTHLQKIIKAMREGRKITFTYRRYGCTATTTYTVSPYCVKLFRRRWYTLVKIDRRSSEHKEGKNKEKHTMAVFSLDRIIHIELEDKKFTVSPKFDAAAYFNECFGIVVGDGSQAERIVLRAYGLESHYMKDLPLHPSQKIISQNDEYTDYELFLRPTSDFKAHILSRGKWVKVLSPQSLADDIKEWLQDAINRYDKEEE